MMASARRSSTRQEKSEDGLLNQIPVPGLFVCMLARGIEASHETIRLWTFRFGTE